MLKFQDILGREVCVFGNTSEKEKCNRYKNIEIDARFWSIETRP
jgi:hypothetical protein